MFRDLPPYAQTTQNPFWSTPTPSHWSVQPGFAVLQENRHKNDGLFESQVLSLSYGQVVVKPVEKQRGLVPDSYEGYQILGPGDIVVRPTDLQNDQTSIRVGHVKDRGIITSAYIGLRPAGDWSDSYAYQYLSVVDSSKRIYGMGSGLRQQLGWPDLKRMPCLVPSAEEQAAIVKYLAHANARIDKAIAAKRRLIALLEEQRDATVRAILATPSDPRAPSKLVATGRLCRIETGVEDSGNADPDGGYPFFVRGREILRASDYHFDTEAVLTPGDGQGGTGKVFHYYNGKFQAHQRVYVFSQFSGILARYFYWYMTAFFREHALAQSNTVTMESLRRPVLASFRVAVPDEYAQRALVERIEARVIDTAQVVEKTQREIALVREFRTRLVADVVTGQVDVRAIAASLPNTLEQDTDLDSLLDDDLEDVLGEGEE